MVAYPQRVGHDRQRRVDRAAGDKKAAVDDVEIVEIVGFAVNVERAGFRIVAEAHRADLMRDTGEGNPLADEQIAREQTFMAVVAVDFALVCCCISSFSLAIRRLWPSSLLGL